MSSGSSHAISSGGLGYNRFAAATAKLAIEDLYRVPELAALLGSVDEERLARRFAVFRTNMLMARSYRPGPCLVSATLYVATEGHPDRTRGWSALALDGLAIMDLPGDHYAVLAEPAVARLAGSMARNLSENEDAVNVA